MNKDVLTCSGIYFLASRFLDGSYIYKVGKSVCIRDRVNQYPQNFSLILQFECINKDISEKEVIRVVEKLEDIGVSKCEKGNEFFRSETDKTKEIKLAIYEWYYEFERTRTREVTREVEESMETIDQPVIKTSSTLTEKSYRFMIDGNRLWKNDKGQLHRIGGPAVEKKDGTKEWYENGQLHRIGGPAIEWPTGTKEWYENDKKHRIGGPAVERADGTKEWYENGKMHRIGGPAVEKADGTKSWYENGKLLEID